MSYQDFRAEFVASISNNAAFSGTTIHSEFLDHTLQELVEFDNLDAPIRLDLSDTRCSKQRLMRIDAYAFDETEHSLVLLISDYCDEDTPAALTMSRVDELYWRLFYYLEEACHGKISSYLTPDDKAFQAAKMIRHRMETVADDSESILKIKFYVLTNRDLDTKLIDKGVFDSQKATGKKKAAKTTKKIKKDSFDGRPIEVSLWPLERFYELDAANRNEPVEIDFYNDFGSEGIPCLKGNIGQNLGYDAYIAIIPGKLLADIYIEHGSKVLEGNVRAFLGTKSAKGVNNGIKRTINNDPTRFFTYNNGIAATASAVTVVDDGGQLLITHVVDLQIINGGQTTATLAETVLKNPAQTLAGIYVPMKLTVIEDRETELEDGVLFYDQMVQSIARYANSQNKVTAADLFSNDPFHIWMERASKKYLAPPVFSSVPTGWYYERARKKYQQESQKLKGDALKRFQLKFPKKQIINKEQLAMYLTAIAGKPHIVSKGKNYVIKEFGEEIGRLYRSSKENFNEFYFRKCVCAAIIYRTVDNYLESNKRDPQFWYKAGGYKLNIVPYSIALIFSRIPKGQTLNWSKIWNEQALSNAFIKEIERVTPLTNSYFCSCSGVIVTEHCKKESTWQDFLASVKYEPSKAFMDELISESMATEEQRSAKKEEKATNDLAMATEIITLGFNYWKNLLETALSQKLLTGPEQAILRQAMQIASSGMIPCSSSGNIPTKTLATIKQIFTIRDRLEAEGISEKPDDSYVKLNITSYNMH
jgi:hypothetical protein